jgi:glycine/D-amino acid oxidase-like deaminating enzyme
MKVVIIGAGFAGLQCAQRLSGKPVDVLLIDRNNYHLFTPLLYQVASSLLNPSDIASPERAVFRGSQDGRELAMMSPQAMQEGRDVADAIVRLERKQPRGLSADHAREGRNGGRMKPGNRGTPCRRYA